MIRIRRALISDMDILVQFRTALFKEMGVLNSKSDEVSFQKACKEYFDHFLSNGEFVAYVAENNNTIVATSGLVFLQKPPDPRNISGIEAYVMNFYTLPEWRSQGIATKLMEEIIAIIKKKGISLIRLHTTETARSTYERIGFIEINNEMELKANSVSE